MFRLLKRLSIFGSILGTLLFLIYIDDLAEGLKSSVKLFADDTSIFSIVKDPTKSSNELNSDLKIIINWAFQCKISFNPDPLKQPIEVHFPKNLIQLITQILSLITTLFVKHRRTSILD